MARSRDPSLRTTNAAPTRPQERFERGAIDPPAALDELRAELLLVNHGDHVRAWEPELASRDWQRDIGSVRLQVRSFPVVWRPRRFGVGAALLFSDSATAKKQTGRPSAAARGRMLAYAASNPAPIRFAGEPFAPH